MTLNEAIEILRKHNNWRRGDDSIPETNPTTLGLAIDTIIKDFDEGYFQTDVFLKPGNKFNTAPDKHLLSIDNLKGKQATEKQPFKITVTQFDMTVTIEKEDSVHDVYEYRQMLMAITTALGYDFDTINEIFKDPYNE